MARRRSRDESSIEMLFDIAAMLPWQVGVVLALVVFAGLHWYAGTEPPVLDMKNPADSLSFVLGNLGRQLAGLLQYVLPGVLLLGSSVSFHRRRRQKTTLARVAADPTSSEVSKLNWAEFEGLVAEAFRQKGYRVVERGGAGPDGGVDLELYLGKDKYLVQCKHWRTYQVGVAIVRELYGVMAAEGAVGASWLPLGPSRPTPKPSPKAGPSSWWMHGPSRSWSVHQAPPRLRPRLRRQRPLARSAVARWSSAPPSEGPTPAAGSGAARTTPSAAALGSDIESWPKSAQPAHAKAPFVGAF